MNLQITLPLQFVRIRKSAAAKNPVNPAGRFEDYPCGGVCETHSLPVGYSFDGWLLCPPKLGECVRLLRFARNGIVCPGYFVSTEIMEILGEHEFVTMNSAYQWTEILSTPGENEDLGCANRSR